MPALSLDSDLHPVYRESLIGAAAIGLIPIAAGNLRPRGDGARGANRGHHELTFQLRRDLRPCVRARVRVAGPHPVRSRFPSEIP